MGNNLLMNLNKQLEKKMSFKKNKIKSKKKKIMTQNLINRKELKDLKCGNMKIDRKNILKLIKIRFWLSKFKLKIKIFIFYLNSLNK